MNYFDSEKLRSDLRGKTVRGGAYTAAGQAARIVVNLAAAPALARLLQPEDFGLVAMALVVTNFAGMFVDAGLSMATVQREELTHHQASNLFWITSGLGVLIALATAAAAPAIAWFYGDPRLFAISLGAACPYILRGFTVQHTAMLRRGMQYRELAVADLGSITVGQLVGISWAYFFYEQDADYWSLVLIPVTASLANLVILYACCPWRPGWYRRSVGTRAMIAFGANLTGFNILNYFARNADKMLLGWWWGSAALGYYSRVYQVMMVPVQRLNGPMTGLVVPALSRVQQEPEKYRQVYRWTIERMLLLSCPLMAYLFVVADWVTVAYLSEAFEPAGPILRYLSLAALWQSLSASIGWLFVSQGRSREMFRWGGMHSVAVLLSFVIGLPFGPVGLAVVYAAVFNCVCLPLAFWLVSRDGPVPFSLLVRVMGSVAPVALAVAIATVIVRLAMPEASPWLGIGATLPAAIVAWLLSAMCTPLGRTAGRELLQLGMKGGSSR